MKWRTLSLALALTIVVSALAFSGILKREKPKVKSAVQKVYVHRTVYQHVDLGVVERQETVDEGTVSYYIFRHGGGNPTLNGTTTTTSYIDDLLDDYGISVPWRTFGDWDQHTVLDGVTGTKEWTTVSETTKTWQEITTSSETQSSGDLQITVVTTTVTTYSQTVRTTTTHRQTASVTYVQEDPLIIDLNGDNLPDVPHNLNQPHAKFFVKYARTFDINGDGLLDLVEWVGPNDGLLAVLNERGTIDSALELFGNAVGYAHGFQKLATLDKNGDGYLTGSELDLLVVWRDKNMDAKAQPEEITPVKALGIVKIAVKPDEDMKSYYVTADGKKHLIWEWWPNAFLGIGIRR